MDRQDAPDRTLVGLSGAGCVTAAEALISSLYEWQRPTEMSARVEELGMLLGNDKMQRRGRAFREAFIAARFALTTEQDAVRILRETNDGVTPDFEVRKEDRLSRYETTEADVPGRKRQLEYREPVPSGVEPMIFTSLDVMVPYMRCLAAKKAAKPYRDCTGLVIHLNPPMFSFNPSFRTEKMREATEPAASAFEEVWLLRDEGVLLWKDGHFVGEIHDDF